MKYSILSTSVSKIVLSKDGTYIDVFVTIFFGAVGYEKMQPSTTGCSVVLLLDIEPRKTLVDELNTKVLAWFDLNYNTIESL